MENLKQLLQNIIKQYIVHNNVELREPQFLNQRYKEGYNLYMERIQEVVKKDTEAASFGLKTKKLTQLQQQAFNVSLTHGLTKFAEFIVTGNSTIEQIN
jgi:hypothetical protein